MKTTRLFIALALALGSMLALAWLLAGAYLPTAQAAPLAPAASVIYVDADAAGSADGLTWSTAFTNVQDALTSAGPEDEIWVAEGVYTPTNAADRTATFQLEDGVALYGGFVATETLRTQRDWETHVTVLSGDLDGNDTTDANGVVTSTANITGTNAYHVVTGSGVTETARLDGFTVTAGKADGGWPHSEGGGMVNENSSSPTLANVTFSGNSADYSGGGMVNENSSSPRLANCILWGNSDSGGTDQSAQIHIADASPITVTYRAGSIWAPATSAPTRSSCAIPTPATATGPRWPTMITATCGYSPHPPLSTPGTTLLSPPTSPTWTTMETRPSRSPSTWRETRASWAAGWTWEPTRQPGNTRSFCRSS